VPARTGMNLAMEPCSFVYGDDQVAPRDGRRVSPPNSVDRGTPRTFPLP